MRQTLTDDFLGLNKNKNCAFLLNKSIKAGMYFSDGFQEYTLLLLCHLNRRNNQKL